MQFEQMTPASKVVHDEVVTFVSNTVDVLSENRLEASGEMIAYASHNQTRTPHFDRAWDKFRGKTQPEDNEPGGPPYSPEFFKAPRRS